MLLLLPGGGTWGRQLSECAHGALSPLPIRCEAPRCPPPPPVSMAVAILSESLPQRPQTIAPVERARTGWPHRRRPPWAPAAWQAPPIGDWRPTPSFLRVRARADGGCREAWWCRSQLGGLLCVVPNTGVGQHGADGPGQRTQVPQHCTRVQSCAPRSTTHQPVRRSGPGARFVFFSRRMI